MFEPSMASTGSLADAGAGAGAWSWNVASGEVSWSTGIEALFGLPEGGFGGTFEAYFSLVHLDDRAYFQAVIARTLSGEDEYVMSHRVVWADKSIHWIDGRGKLSRDAEGRPLLLSGIVWTAVARKRAEAKLVHLRRVEAVASAVRKELLRVKSDGEAFQHACRIAVEHGHFRFAWIGIVTNGLQRVEPVARAGIEDGYLDEVTVHEDLTMYGRGPVGICLREGHAVVVNDIAGADSFSMWREQALHRGLRGCGAFPLRRGGNLVGAMVIYAAEENRFDPDQTELLQGLADDIGFELDSLEAEARRCVAENAMRRSEERYRALVEQAADAIFLADADGRLLEVNAATCDLLGYSHDELVGRNVNELTRPLERVEPPLPDASTQRRLAEERRLLRKDGSVLDVEVSAVVLADGRIQSYARDTTQRKVVQQRLVVTDRLASLGRLAAGVAHEINNPLTYLSLSLERIEWVVERSSQASPDLDTVREAASDARDGIERVRAIVRSLAGLSRQEEAPISAVDIHQVLDGSVRLAENAVRHRGRISKAYGATRPVRGSELRLSQVFINLLLNAADALPESSRETNAILVKTLDEGDRVTVLVHDNGVGISPENLGRIFDPFFTTKPVGEGTGLGLAISHGIVRGFDGRIDVESTLATGTTFRVSLVAEEQKGSSALSTTPRLLASRGRLLVIDDEPRVAALLAASLARLDVTVVISGSEALAILERETYDCILCDLMMPGVSGMDVYAELVRNGRGQERTVIFMTGGAFTASARDFVASVPNEVLDKPFPMAQCERAIAEMIERCHPSSVAMASALESPSRDD